MTISLSESLEDYIEVIADLADREGHAHTKAVAEKLQVKMPSVSAALRQLAELGLIDYSRNRPVELTPEGRRLAARVRRRHEVLAGFFSGILGIAPEKADAAACRIEHVVDDATVERFRLFTDAIMHRSDARALQIYLTEAMARQGDDDAGQVCVLSELPVGAHAILEGGSRNLAATSISDWRPGCELTLVAVALDRSSWRVQGEEGEVVLSPEIAENLWVRRLPQR